MHPYLQACLIICLSLFVIAVFRYLVLKKLNLKYTLLWLAAIIVLLILLIFPNIINKLAALMGVVEPPNAAFFFAIFFLAIIMLTITAIVSHLSNRIYRLTQTQALLEKRIRDLENKLKENEPKEAEDREKELVP